MYKCVQIKEAVIMKKALKVSRGKAKKRSNSIEHLLEVAHRQDIITEWAPLLTREKINRAYLEYGPERS